MDGSRRYLLEQLKSCCKQRTDGSWALLAAAAGDDRCIQEVYNTLVGYTWQYIPTGPAPDSPMFAQWRVLAISISRADLLEELLARWEREPNTNNFENFDSCSEWIFLAARTAKNFFKTQQLNPTEEPWSWEEYASRLGVPDNLINRPLKETILTLADIQKFGNVRGAAIKALRTQAVKIDREVFEHYSQSIDTTDCYVIALLIELSRKTEFPADIWIENVLRVFPKIQDPIKLMYITGGLLNPQWQIPSWYS